MKSKLLGKKTIQEIATSKEISSIISTLFEHEYKPEIEEFGGLKIKSDQVDFALSKNLAKNLQKLVKLTRGKDREIMQGIAGRWDLYNIRLAIEAKERKRSFDSIAKYIIDVGRYNATAIKEAMREETLEGMLSRLMINSPYKRVLSTTLETYKKTRSGHEALLALEREYYAYLARIAVKLGSIDHWSAARMLRMEIDMHNILTMIRGKRANLKYQSIAELMIPSGNIGKEGLEQAYNGAKDIEDLAAQIKIFDLKDAVEFYRKDKHKQLLTFEVGLRNAIFVKGIKSLGHSILAFGTMLAYMYMKETEVYTLRILINGRSYGLEKDDIDRLMGWKAT